jgi:hypothetical protein
MSGFSADWLALREPYDLAARNAAVLDAMAETFLQHGSVSIVDLACGTGSTLRAVAPRLPAQQRWRLVDNNLSLLAKAAALSQPPRLTVAAKPVDLARDLELALDGPLDLITTSALLDLVSDEWLERLVVEAAARRLPVYAALTYDGRTTVAPAAELDAEVLAAFDAHQRTDKGFGPALGPSAARRAVERFERVGYSVVHGPSDWVFGPDDRIIQEALLAGWAEVAATMQSSQAAVDRWLAQRRADLAAGRSQLSIGHIDFFARPMGLR